MSDTWGPRAHPERCDWPEQDLRRRRIGLERDLIVWAVVGFAAAALVIRFHYWGAIINWLAMLRGA